MARPPVRQIAMDAQLRPVAGPVDTFVQPGPDPLRDLADALTPLSPELREFASLQAAKDKELADKYSAIAERDAYAGKDMQEAEATAIRNGDIPAQAGKHYVKSFKNAQGLVAGQNIRQKYADAYRNWADKDSEDPEAYDKFLEGFIKANVNSDDPEVLAGLLPSIRELQQNGRTTYLSDRSERLITQAVNTTAAGAMGTVDDGLAAGQASEKGANYQAIFDKVAEWRNSYAQTEDPDRIDKVLIEAMGAKILESRDPKLLAWFDQKVPGQDYTYGQTPAGIQMKRQLTDQLVSIANEADTRERAKVEREDKAATEQATANVIRSIFSGEEPSEADIQTAEMRGDPTIRTKIKGWRESAQNDGFTDQSKLMSVYSDVMAGGGTAAVQRAAEQGVFGKASDFTAAWNFAEGVKSNPKVDELLDSNTSKQAMTTIHARTRAKTPDGEVLTGLSNEGLEAQYDYRRLVTEWAMANPNATAIEAEDAMSKIGDSIFKRITTPEDDFEAGQYNRDEALGFENVHGDGKATPQEAGQAEPTEPPPEAAAEAEQGGTTVEGTTFTPDQWAGVQAQAKQRGISPEDYVREQLAQNTTYDANYEDPRLGEGDLPGRGLSVEDAEAFLDEALVPEGMEKFGTGAGDNNLLGLIRHHEAAGNYNAVFGRANSQVDLSQFSLDQILGQQQAARRQGKASTAIGAYQFIYKTLSGIKQEMGLTGREAFTPDLQDAMAVHLLKRRGLDAYRAGKISKREFALRLSQEWASLPNPNTGRSFYAGDGLNASSVPTSRVLSILGLDGFAGAGAEATAFVEADGTGPEDPFGIKMGEQGSPLSGVPTPTLREALGIDTSEANEVDDGEQGRSLSQFLRDGGEGLDLRQHLGVELQDEEAATLQQVLSDAGQELGIEGAPSIGTGPGAGINITSLTSDRPGWTDFLRAAAEDPDFDFKTHLGIDVNAKERKALRKAFKKVAPKQDE